MVDLACIGNVDIQVFSGVGRRLYFIRRLQVYLFIIFHVLPISQGVTLLFFFTEKKKEAKKEKSSHSTCTVRFKHHPKITQEILTNKTPPEGHTGGCRRRNITLFTLEIGG